MTQRRPLAEHCQRLSVGQLRPLVPPDAEAHRLADGTLLQLRWAEVRGCFGGRGRALVIRCPRCDSHARVVWRPPGREWGCWRCQPVSTAAHRRSGARRGRGKPTSWHLARIETEQQRIAHLLGIVWPPQMMLWTWRTLGRERRLPGARRLSARRRLALQQRTCALETVRVALLIPQIRAELQSWGQALPAWDSMPVQVAAAHELIGRTEWAMRRTPANLRTARGGASVPANGIAGGDPISASRLNLRRSPAMGLAIADTAGSVAGVATARGHADDSATEAQRLGADAGHAR